MEKPWSPMTRPPRTRLRNPLEPTTSPLMRRKGSMTQMPPLSVSSGGLPCSTGPSARAYSAILSPWKPVNPRDPSTCCQVAWKATIILFTANSCVKVKVTGPFAVLVKTSSLQEVPNTDGTRSYSGLTIKFEGCSFRTQNLWREVIFSLSRSFRRLEVKVVIAHSVNANARSIGDASIDATFGKLLGAPDRNASYYYKLQIGKNFASEVVRTILIGLQVSETSWCFSFNKQTKRHVPNPITCGDCICPRHNPFGIFVGPKLSQLTVNTQLTMQLEIKSFAEPLIILDEQFQEDYCEHCGSPKNIDIFLSNKLHFLMIVLSWLGCKESQGNLSEVLVAITSPIDAEFFCKSAHSSAMYTVASMICYGDGCHVCFAHSKG